VQTYVDDDLFGVSGLLLVGDGFLVPGKDSGSVTLIPINGDAPITLSQPKSGYFYHKTEWLDMNGDGLLDILTCRATKPLFGTGSGEMLWLEQPASGPLSNGSWAAGCAVSDRMGIAFTFSVCPGLAIDHGLVRSAECLYLCQPCACSSVDRARRHARPRLLLRGGRAGRRRHHL
jgi:hypothetical protein